MRPSRSKRYFFAGHAAVSIFSSLSLSSVFIDFSIRNIDRYTSICGISKRRGKNRLLTIDRAMKSENTDITCFFLREFSMIPYESTALCCIASSRSIYIHIYRRCVSPISSFSGIVPRTVGRAIEIDAFFPSTNSLVRLNRRLMEIDLMVNAFSGGPSVFKQRDGKSIA